MGDVPGGRKINIWYVDGRPSGSRQVSMAHKWTYPSERAEYMEILNPETSTYKLMGGIYPYGSGSPRAPRSGPVQHRYTRCHPGRMGDARETTAYCRGPASDSPGVDPGCRGIAPFRDGGCPMGQPVMTGMLRAAGQRLRDRTSRSHPGRMGDGRGGHR